MMQEHPTNQLESYILGLLAPTEQAEIAAHLAYCQLCQHDLRSVEETLNSLAHTVAQQTPPPELEDRLMADIEVLRRDSPARTLQTIPLHPILPVAPRVTKQDARLRQRHVRSSATQPQRLSWLLRREWSASSFYAVVAVAALLLLAVGILGTNLSAAQAENASLAKQSRQQQTALAILSNPHAVLRSLSAQTSAAGKATAVMAMDPKSQQAVVVFTHLPSLVAGKTYQFWLVLGTSATAVQVVPIHTFTAMSDGSALLTFRVTAPLNQVQNAGVSIEKAGGVQKPDSPMIMLLA